MNMNPTILDLDNDQARRLLMQSESYCTIKVPDYIDFSDVLAKAEKSVSNYRSSIVTAKCLNKAKGGGGNGGNCRSDSADFKKLFDGINCRILQNKDGLLSWRPMELINPMIYAVMVYKLTEENSWEIVRNRFAEFQQCQNIECCSIPRGVFTYAEKGAILNWWDSFEQRSIALSLEFQYMGKTDISDCYGAIYTHSISWALHGKGVAKEKGIAGSRSDLLGDEIDSLIQSMHSRQTTGIPQGSVLSDLIAEIVLGYADLLLSQELNRQPSLTGCKYKILRYRDDYRIFSTSRETVHAILLSLMKVLSGLNFKLGSAKTSISDDVVLDSVKIDKVDWLLSGCDQADIHKWLLAVSRFSRKHPQSGTVVNELQKLTKTLEDRKLTPYRIDVLVAQIVDLVVRNPRCYPVGARILSMLLKDVESDEQQDYLEKIIARCRMVPNSGLFEIWLQRIARAVGLEVDYDEGICQAIEAVVKGDEGVVNPWPWQWLQDPLRRELESFSILKIDRLKSLSVVISSDEAGDLSTYSYAGA